ncbi:MAG: hypothetical protein ABIR24_00270 [Verrucomicrobiota bacterium]
MKKLIMSAVLFMGVGLASSQAGVSFGFSLSDSHHHHRSRERVIVVPQQHCAPAPVYVRPQPVYRGESYSSGYYNGSRAFERHEDLHHNLEHQHEQYHHDAEHRREAFYSGW